MTSPLLSGLVILGFIFLNLFSLLCLATVCKCWRLKSLLYNPIQCVTNIRICIRICEYQSEYSYLYSYSPFFVNPNIFVFVFALFIQTEYIRIRIRLFLSTRIYLYSYLSKKKLNQFIKFSFFHYYKPSTINCILEHICALICILLYILYQ